MLHYSTAAALATLLKRAAVSGEHTSLYKRAFGGAEPDAPVYELPGWAPLVVLINVAVFFPILLIVSILHETKLSLPVPSLIVA